MPIKHSNTVALYCKHFLALYITEVLCAYVSRCSSSPSVCVAGQALVTVFCGWFTACQRVEEIKCAVWLLSFPLSLSPPFIPSFLYVLSSLAALSISHSLFMAESLSPTLLQHKIADIKSFALFIALFQCSNDFHILHEALHAWCHALSDTLFSLGMSVRLITCKTWLSEY